MNASSTSTEQPCDDAWIPIDRGQELGACGFCSPAVYRCHDGEKRTSPTGEWQFTICEGLATCSGAPLSC